MSKQNILILGGLGFLGKNLYLKLAAEGFNVTLLSDTVAESDTFLIPAVRSKVIEGSILDKEFIEKSVAGFDTIFSFAGHSGASDSILDPYVDLDSNLRGHLNVLEACRKNNPDVQLIFPSSRLVYGKPIRNPVNEDHPIVPESIYAIHKVTTEHYYHLYQRLYGLRCIVFRISNPFGPYQRFGSNHYGILNWFIHKAIVGQEIEIYGDGSQQRDFIFVSDLVDLFAKCIHSPQMYGKTFNVGSGVGVSLKQAVQIICNYKPGTRVNYVPWPGLDQKIETGDYITDISLLRQQVDWSPATSFEEGIRATIAFYDGAKQ